MSTGIILQTLLVIRASKEDENQLSLWACRSVMLVLVTGKEDNRSGVRVLIGGRNVRFCGVICQGLEWTKEADHRDPHGHKWLDSGAQDCRTPKKGSNP